MDSLERTRFSGVIWIITLSCLFSFLSCSVVAAAEPKPGDILNQENWQQAKSLLPEGMLPRFQDGSYQAKIMTSRNHAWGSKFKSATETNAGKFDVDADGARSWPRTTKIVPPFLYGSHFRRSIPRILKPQPKVIYNFTYTLMQADDMDRSSSLYWVTPTSVQNHIEFRTQLLFHGSRFSGPLANPDMTLRKGIIAGIAPAEVFGVMILEWVYLDPQHWNSLWIYVPELRRVRQLPPYLMVLIVSLVQTLRMTIRICFPVRCSISHGN